MSKPKLRPWQFSLRSLFVLTTICSIIFAIGGRAWRQQAAVREIEALGGWVDYHKPIPLGIETLADVKWIGFSYDCKQVTDDDLRHLAEMTEVEEIFLYYTSITDEGLKHLTGLTKLKELGLCQTKVTPKGIAKLKESLPLCVIYHDWGVVEADGRIRLYK